MCPMLNSMDHTNALECAAPAFVKWFAAMLQNSAFLPSQSAIDGTVIPADV